MKPTVAMSRAHTGMAVHQQFQKEGNNSSNCKGINTVNTKTTLKSQKLETDHRTEKCKRKYEGLKFFLREYIPQRKPVRSIYPTGKR
jgi:hypothetical protein